MDDAIKAELSEFLKYFDFKKMNSNFFVLYVVKRSFLFSYNELIDIRESILSNVKVKVTNSKGTSICCILPGDSDVIKIIKSLKNCLSENPPSKRHMNKSFVIIYWKTECKIPSTPAQIKKRDFVSWYLIYLPDGKIAVTPKVTENDYLIAEMYENEYKYFIGTSGCKIDIV